MDEAELEARGLYDPAAPDADDRLALLKYLDRLGISADELERAVADGTLLDLAGHRRLAPGDLTAADLCARTGLDIEELRRIWTWAGLPPRELDERRFSEDDAVLLISYLTFSELLDEETAYTVLRVYGSAFARMADTLAVEFLRSIEPRHGATTSGELEHATANTQAILGLRSAADGFGTLFAHHLRWALRRARAAHGAGGTFEAADMAVGFVDLVGYTSFSQHIDHDELGRLMDRFEAIAHEAVVSRDGRIVKLIGDAVMFVAVDAEPACDIALSLLEGFSDAATGVAPRGGVAVGRLLTRAGDVFGPVVNLASRVGELAVPDEILVTNEVHLRVELGGADAGKTLGPGRASKYLFENAGRRKLKGFDEPVRLFSITRA